ncbi:MAG: molybdenum cofactor guanylyltransferase [Chloroflexi bacterium]|nr:molybdenum cofactor guanylyltransferase [Chloroflexota bacterium]
MPFSLVILAGGRATRMGTNKCVTPLAGKPVLAYVLNELSSHAAETLLITNDPAPYASFGLPVYPDDVPGAGPLGGLATALRRASQPLIVLTACDMPFIRWGLVEYLLSLAGSAQVVLPRVRGEAEPLLAVYSRTCLPAVEHALSAGERRMVSFLSAVRVREVAEEDLLAVDPTGMTFFNLNTPDDVTRAEKMVREVTGDKLLKRQ